MSRGYFRRYENELQQSGTYTDLEENVPSLVW